MARYAGVIDNFPKLSDYEDTMEGLEAQETVLTTLMNHSRDLPDGCVVGSVLQFQVADNYAYYIVSSRNPLTVKHIPFCDGYHAHKLIIQGLDEDYILEDREQQKKWAELFNKED